LRARALLGGSQTIVPLDSLRYRRPGESVASLAFIRDALNHRPHGLEVGSLGGSMARVSTTLATVEIVLAVAWIIGVAAGILALVLVPVRALVRRLRKRSLRPSAARPIWRTAMVASLLALAPVAAVVIGGAGLAKLGNLSGVSGTIYGAGLAFAAWAIFGTGIALGRRHAPGRWASASLWCARSVLVLHLVAAVYFTYWGYIGWQTWG